MTSVLAAIYGSVATVSLIALVGVVSLRLDPDRLHQLVRYLVSFAAGSLFGDTFLHLVPEIVAEAGFGPTTGLSLLGGIVLAYVVEAYIAWHHHHHPHEDRPEPLSYMILVGDAVHNFIDGAIIAASYLAAVPLGVASTVAIALHEVPQEIGDFGVLLYGGVPRRRAIVYNLLTALTAFAGATLVVAVAGRTGWLTTLLLPVAAGNFVYIAGTDLLPELMEEVEARRATAQLLTFCGGIGVMYLLTIVG